MGDFFRVRHKHDPVPYLYQEGYKELDIITLPEDLPALGLKAGDIGTVHDIYDEGRMVHAEFDDEGQTTAFVGIRLDPEPHVTVFYDWRDTA